MRFADYIQKPKIKHALVGVVLFLCALVFYYPSLSVGFLSDDWHAISIAQNTENVLSFFGTNIVGERGGSSYGPIYNLVMYAQYQLFDLHASLYHLMSVVLLSMTAFMLYGVIRRVWNNTLMAYASALFFICIPSHVEAVVWISGQPHLIATFLYVLALYCYSVFSSQQNKTYFIFACMSIAGSLLTKEIGITFLVPFLLIDYRFGRISVRKEKIKESLLHGIKFYVPLFAIVIMYLFLRAYATGILLGYYGDSSLSFSIGAYVRMSLKMTVGMFFSYPLRDGIVASVIQNLWLSLLVGGVGIATLVLICRKKIAPLVGIIIAYGVSLLPYLSLQYNALSNEGERYTYLPSVFVAVCMAYVLYQLIERLQRRTVVCAFLTASIVLLLLNPIGKKTDEWTRAGEIVRETLPTIESIHLDPERPVVFVGLPDRIAGAQLLRNGTFLAIEMLGYGTFVGDRVLASPLLPREYKKEDELVRVEYCGSTTSVACIRSVVENDRLFTGLPYSELYGIEATLEGFRNTDHTGTHIKIQKNDPEVQVVYFHHNSFYLLEG